ncbi:MAG TPA: hypothetical protein VLF64_02755 [Candidatus Saccharimonadales bacterium]|nr:hypothetical protein [Candidatus Saccharimonadales bacterium]
MKKDDQTNDKPVAYDTDGKPLFATPQQPTEPEVQRQIVHIARSTDPIRQEVSPEIQKKHNESMRLYPNLNLSDAEYVISSVRRHPIGLFAPVFVTGLLVAMIASFLANYYNIMQLLHIVNIPKFGTVLLLGVLAIILVLMGGYIAIWVYLSNQFFLTNESVIQEIQLTLFSRREQTVSLLNIEDASFLQTGILQTMFNYGSIRLSTEGEETTYRFSYVANPRAEIAQLNNAVEAFKNGRPVEVVEANEKN